MKNLILQSIFACILFSSCQPTTSDKQSDIPESKTITKATFVSNPQPVEAREVKTLDLGASAPDFKLPATDGKYYSLSDFKSAKALAIIFTCNHCPTAQAYEGRIISITNDYKDKGLQVIAISPNSPLGLLYEELGYSDLNDDYKEMIVRHKDKNFNFPYLYDGDNEEASLKYGPVATPHAFLFDENRKLVYKGRLDKVEKPGTTNGEDLRVAIDATLEGKEVANPETKTFGCSTKWGWKLEMKKKTNEEWKRREVKIQDIDESGIQTLLENKDSKKLRLINVWATWCGPCIIEFPDFVVLQRMYGARDFEFVSLSADKPEQKDKALKFLKEKHAAFTNYIFSNDDKYALIEAIDPEWNGALPYTLLIEPDGKVVWKQQGEVDFFELKKAIVEHEMIGRYF